MKYAIELYFDGETEEKLSRLIRRVADENISAKFSEWNTRPHLTLACCNDVDERKCKEQLKAFALKQKPIPAQIASVGMFPDTRTVFVSPIVTGKTVEFGR